MLSCIELLVAHLLTGTTQGFLFQCCLIAILIALKNHKLFIGLFACIYVSLNFWVNLTDFFYTGLIHEYYHDEFFLTSFSYKLH